MGAIQGLTVAQWVAIGPFYGMDWTMTTDIRVIRNDYAVLLGLPKLKTWSLRIL
jgi:hypothetical protein